MQEAGQYVDCRVEVASLGCSYVRTAQYLPGVKRASDGSVVGRGWACTWLVKMT